MFDSESVLAFWFKSIEPAMWWRKDEAFDALIAQRFGDLIAHAAQGGCAPWRDTPEGRLAEIIVLDQFSRNVFRGTPQSFAQDALALRCAQDAVAAGADKDLPLEQRAFVYMPFMHSEDPQVHEQAVVLFDQPGLEGSLDFEHKHKAIIDRFGHYPHRNAVLGRVSTPEEIAFLQQPFSSF